MRNGIFLACLLATLTACGVNPDRLETMRQRNEDVAEGTANTDVVVEYNDGDPKALRDAVSGLRDMETSLAAAQYDAYVAKRYEVTNVLSPELAPELASNEKRDLVLSRVAQLDSRLGASASERAMTLVGSKRVTTASSDALYAIQDSIDSCARAAVSGDKQMSSDLYRKFEAGLERARSLDGSSLSYVGRRPSGAGIIDVPIEVALCDAKMARRQAEAADEAPVATSLSSEYQGCAAFDVNIEAAQTGANAFGDFQIPGAGSQPAAVPAVCEKFPPASDAPSNVQRALRDKALWLKAGDIVSMAGPFEYDQRETLYKKGVARVYRKDATLKTNKCGAEGTTVTCEAEGSDVATAVNLGGHFMARADVHRKQSNTARCKEMADRSYKTTSIALTSSSDAQILLATGETITKIEAQARLEALKSQANDALASDWCEKP
jgi:hypothetical protein